MNKGALRLYKKLKHKAFQPKSICEVGVFNPEESNILLFIKENVKTTLIEADPEYASNIRKYFGDLPTLTVIEAAVYDYNGTVELYKRASSTFIATLESSPALVNDNYKKDKKDSFLAKSILFSDIDTGEFELVSIDIEGAEWFVLKHMNSRPAVISIETHGKYYTNPHYDKIKKWMSENKYELWFTDSSDSVFIRRGTFKVNIFEKLKLLANELKFWLVRRKKILKNLTRKNK